MNYSCESHKARIFLVLEEFLMFCYFIFLSSIALAVNLNLSYFQSVGSFINFCVCFVVKLCFHYQ